jgi:hypothetical protein
MSEAEIDGLMQGQEDENGSINFEGKLSSLPSIRSHPKWHPITYRETFS